MENDQPRYDTQESTFFEVRRRMEQQRRFFQETDIFSNGLSYQAPPRPETEREQFERNNLFG